MQIADAATTRMVEDVLKGNSNSQDDRLMVKFYLGALENTAESEKQGRPIFDEVEFISIAVPGQLDRVDRPAWRLDFERFARQYAAFKSGLQAAESGTPLSVWPVIKANQVAELATRNVRTVEQLANIADIDAQKFMGMNELRQRARDFIEAAKGSAPLTAMRTELEARDAKIALLESQMAEVIAQATKASKESEKQPGQQSKR